MPDYDYQGNPLPQGKKILIGAVLDAGSGENRFKAMKQLLDIAKKKIQLPDAEIAVSEFTFASKGAVAILPDGPPAMYERHALNLLYSKAATVQSIPASTTKVMSLITGMDFVQSVKERVSIKASDIQSGSGNVFSAGDTLTIEELMLAMTLPSSNTAAQAFARICGAKMLEAAGVTSYTDTECRTAFIAQMNGKAAYIGMTGAEFTSASGLATDNKMTITDMMQMIVEACSYPEICKVWGKKQYTIAVGGSNQRNVLLETTVTDSAIEASYTILGGKTGSLDSGATAAALVMVAEVVL